MTTDEKRELLEQIGRQLGKRASELRAADLRDWLAIDNARWEQFMAEIRDLRSGTS